MKKAPQTLGLQGFEWGRQESNLHLRRDWILNPARLPVPPRPQNQFNGLRRLNRFALRLPTEHRPISRLEQRRLTNIIG